VKVDQLEEKPTEVAAHEVQPKQSARSEAALGLTVRPLEPREQQQAGTTGSLVVEESKGPAQAADVEPGDIILGVNGKRVHSVQELQAAAHSAGKNVALLIQREDAQIFVPLRLP
jgi:serine protease Do